MKQFFFLLAFSVTLIGQAQTKSIAAKRHGETLKRYHHWDGIESATSNFGQAPMRIVRHSELKKIVFVNDTTTIMVTEEKCHDSFQKSQNENQLWRAGSDTLINHPVFSAKISTDSMRTILKDSYFFVNDMKDVDFEGFETTKENQEAPRRKEFSPTNKNKKPTTNQMGWSKWLPLLLVSVCTFGIIRLK